MTPEEIDDLGFREIIDTQDKHINKLKTELKVAHKFIKQLAAAHRMQAPMHYMRTCKCDVCDLMRQARRITGP